MRGHHEEAHVVGDLLGRQQRAFVRGRLAKLGEDVRPVPGATRVDLAAEIIDHEGAALHAPRHLRAGNGLPHDGDAGRHHVDEGPLQLRDFRAELGAEKRHGGEVEGQLLDRGIEQHVSPPGPPTGDPAFYAAVEAREIRLHRPGLECDRQGLAMQTMLVEIEQHQPAREKPLEQNIPAVLRGENLRLIEEDELVRLRPQKRDVAAAEGSRAVDAAEAGGHALDLALRIREQRERRTDHRPAVRAGNVSEQFERRLVDRVGSEMGIVERDGGHVRSPGGPLLRRERLIHEPDAGQQRSDRRGSTSGSGFSRLDADHFMAPNADGQDDKQHLQSQSPAGRHCPKSGRGVKAFLLTHGQFYFLKFNVRSGTMGYRSRCPRRYGLSLARCLSTQQRIQSNGSVSRCKYYNVVIF